MRRWSIFLFFGTIVLGAVFWPQSSQSITMAERTSGYILLQVEKNGEAWYVYPKTLTRFYLGRPADAFTLMRQLGLGISNANLAKIPVAGSSAQGDLALRKKLSGYILLQVEKNGEAWYVYPKNKQRYYLGRPADAYSIMRRLGLGISNTDLAQIKVAYYSFTSACQGYGVRALTVAPIDLDVIRSVHPLGKTGSSDVIAPESHDLFFNNLDTPVDSYAVVAPAAGVVVSVFEQGTFQNPGSGGHKIYQVIIAHTCTEYTLFGSLSSVDPKVKAGQSISAGQPVGRVGGSHSWDFGVLDTARPNRYVVPTHYSPLKLYGRNAFDYFSDFLKLALAAKSPRNIAPKGGTLEFDQDGTLVGNWYRQGTGGFNPAPGTTDYAKNWLAFTYDYIDVSHPRFSLGNYQGESRQFGVNHNAPDPVNVSVASGIIKYELVDYQWMNATTGQLEKNTDVFDPANTYTAVNDSSVIGVLLAQLTTNRTLKLQVFPDKTADQVSGFTDQAILYQR